MVDAKSVVETSECDEKESVEMGAGVVERPAVRWPCYVGRIYA